MICCKQCGVQWIPESLWSPAEPQCNCEFDLEENESTHVVVCGICRVSIDSDFPFTGERGGRWVCADCEERAEREKPTW